MSVSDEPATGLRTAEEDGAGGDSPAPEGTEGWAGTWVSAAQARTVRGARTYWPLLLVFVLAFAIRLYGITTWLPECTPEQYATRTSLEECYAVGGDAYYYNSMAANVAAGNGFVITAYGSWSHVPKADRPPGYVVFLAGLNSMGLDSVTAHRDVLAVLGSVTAVLMGLLGWRLGGRHARATGITAGVLAAVYPGFWMSEVYYMSESLFVPLIVLFLLATYRFWRHPGWVNAVLMGAAAGAAWLVRGEAALLLGLVVTAMVLLLKGPSFWRKVAMGAAACAVCIVMMLPWVAHNLSRFDETVYIATTGTAFALNSCDAVWYGDATGWYSFGCLNDYSAQAAKEDGILTDAGVRQRATAYIQDHLADYPRVALVRVGRLFGVYSNTDTIDRNVTAEGRRFEGVQAQHWMYYGFVAFGVLGLAVLRHRRVPISPLLAVLLGVALTVANTFAIYRYRLAADVALMAAASVGLVWAARYVRDVATKKRPPVPPQVESWFRRGEPEPAATG